MLFSVLFILRFAFLTSVICAFSSLTVLVVSLCISCLSQSCHRLCLFTFCLCVKSAFLLCYFLVSCESLLLCALCSVSSSPKWNSFVLFDNLVTAANTPAPGGPFPTTRFTSSQLSINIFSSQLLWLRCIVPQWQLCVLNYSDTRYLHCLNSNLLTLEIKHFNNLRYRISDFH